MCASLRSLNAHQRLTKATLQWNLQEKCRSQWAQNAETVFVRACAAETHVKISPEPLLTATSTKNDAAQNPRRRLCASLRSRNAGQDFTSATLYRNLEVKCRGPAPWSSTGLYLYRKNPSVWTHCLGEKQGENWNFEFTLFAGPFIRGGLEGSNEIPACLFIFFCEINLSQCDGPNRNIWYVGVPPLHFPFLPAKKTQSYVRRSKLNSCGEVMASLHKAPYRYTQSQHPFHQLGRIAARRGGSRWGIGFLFPLRWYLQGNSNFYLIIKADVDSFS